MVLFVVDDKKKIVVIINSSINETVEAEITYPFEECVINNETQKVVPIKNIDTWRAAEIVIDDKKYKLGATEDGVIYYWRVDDNNRFVVTTDFENFRRMGRLPVSSGDFTFSEQKRYKITDRKIVFNDGIEIELPPGIEVFEENDEIIFRGDKEVKKFKEFLTPLKAKIALLAARPLFIEVEKIFLETKVKKYSSTYDGDWFEVFEKLRAFFANDVEQKGLIRVTRNNNELVIETPNGTIIIDNPASAIRDTANKWISKMMNGEIRGELRISEDDIEFYPLKSVPVFYRIKVDGKTFFIKENEKIFSFDKEMTLYFIKIKNNTYLHVYYTAVKKVLSGNFDERDITGGFNVEYDTVDLGTKKIRVNANKIPYRDGIYAIPLTRSVPLEKLTTLDVPEEFKEFKKTNMKPFKDLSRIEEVDSGYRLISENGNVIIFNDFDNVYYDENENPIDREYIEKFDKIDDIVTLLAF